MNLKAAFSRSVGLQGAALHFAAHSHHPWPDVTSEAQAEYWNLSARALDTKWGTIFGDTIPQVQSRIAQHLGLPDGGSICFSPNTHDFAIRILSSLGTGRPVRVLTTDSEFHSFARQVTRLEEEGLADVTRVPTEPFDTFQARMRSRMASASWDLVWFSHVFFNSGYAIQGESLNELVRSVTTDATIIVVDGYHAFMALPVSLAGIASRAFYLAGGYKYAMAGEGVCFMHCPQGFIERPRATGWFAEFGALEGQRGDRLAYAPDGGRFYGATFDPSGLFRMKAVMKWLQEQHLTVDGMHGYCRALQRSFLDMLKRSKTGLSADQLVVSNLEQCGRFLAFRTRDAGRIDTELAQRGIIVDHRGDVLRIGFGIYQDTHDVERLVEALASLKR